MFLWPTSRSDLLLSVPRCSLILGYDDIRVVTVVFCLNSQRYRRCRPDLYNTVECRRRDAIFSPLSARASFVLNDSRVDPWTYMEFIVRTLFKFDYVKQTSSCAVVVIHDTLNKSRCTQCSHNATNSNQRSNPFSVDLLLLLLILCRT